MFSVIIPVHNSEKTLNRCLESLLNQSYGNFEALLIENGSTDNSYHICQDYENRDSRFKAYDIGKCNGPSKPRNYALDIAKGDYIVFLDSDDWVETDCLELYNEALEKNDYALCSYVVEDANGSIISEVHPCITASNSRDQSIQMIKANCFGYTWCKSFRKSLLEKLRFNEDIDLFEDSVFTTQLMAKSPKICIIDKVIYHYVGDNPNAITKIVHKDMIIKKDIQFSAWNDFFGSTYETFMIQFANDCVKFCKTYVCENSLKLKESYQAIKKSRFYKKAIKKPCRDTLVFSKGYVFYLIEMYSKRLKVFIYRSLHKR